LDPAGEKMFSVEKKLSMDLAASLGITAAHEILSSGGNELLERKQHA
jgi:hypothetical protein